MSLKVWMPLTEDMHNQGLYWTNPGANGGIFENSGKLGKCLKTSGTIDTGLPYTEWNYSTDSITMCCWVKFNLAELRTALPQSITGSNYTTPTGNLLGFNSYGGLAIIWSTNNVYSDGQVNYVYLSGCYRSGDNSKVTNSYTIPFDTWIHVALVFNKTSNIMRLYINGSVHNEITMPSTTTVSQSNFRINVNAVWGGNGPTKAISFRINDVRCYNNALSAEEVKEISKGLILHYPLNDTQILTNAFNYPTFDTPTNAGGWLHWGPSGYSATYSQNTDKQFIFNKTRTYSHKVSNTGSTYFICYQEPAFDGGYRSAQAIIKMSDGSDPTGKVGFSHNANVGTNPPNTFHHLGDGFYLIKHEGFRQDGSNDLVSISVQAGVTAYISEAYLENDRTVCSDLFQGNIVYDESGYGNNGTITGTLTNSTDTPRYDKCTQFNNSGITTNYTNNGIDVFTYAAWIKLNSYPGERSCISIGGTYFTINSEGKLSGYAYGKTPDNGYVNGTTVIPLNTWTHVALVWTSTQLLGYVNGEVDVTYNCSGVFNRSINPQHCIGSEYGDGSHRIFNGYISDLREYATALSADDVKALYQEAAFIDHKGNIGCYQFYEDADSQITKTGQVKTEEFEEISDLTDGVAKVYEQKIECNQLIEI